MVNGTFFLQALHFFLAYIIIERLLFAPAVKEIFAEQAKKKQLQDTIDVQDLSIQQLQNKQQQDWQAASQRFLTIEPPIKRASSFKIVQQLPSMPDLDKAQKKELVVECAIALAKDIEHVD